MGNIYSSGKARYQRMKAEKRLRQDQKQLDKKRAITRKPAEVKSDFEKLKKIVGQNQFDIEVGQAKVKELTRQMFNLKQEFELAVEIWKDEPKVADETVASEELLSPEVVIPHPDTPSQATSPESQPELIIPEVTSEASH